MAPDPLSPDSIVHGMADALPTREQGDTTSSLSSSYEAIALFTHACMVSLGFRLLGFNEDQKIETECQRIAPRLPSKWNASFNSFSFVYAHTQSSMQFVIKIDRLGGKAEIRGLAVGDERIARFEVTARDYVSSAALPLRIPLQSSGSSNDQQEGPEEEDRTDLPQRLQSVFTSRERISDLANLLKINVIQKLLPSLQKEGYEESRRDQEEILPRRTQQPRNPLDMPDPAPAQPRPYPVTDPLADLPRRPIPAGDFPPPGFEDEYEINQPPRGPLIPPSLGGLGGGRSPFNIGHDDLNPPGLGPHDPLRGSFVPGGGLPRPGGGGMHPTFDDPLFRGPHEGGGDDGQFDPQAPAGARWDPVGPGGAPRFGGGRPGRGNPFGGGNNQFGGGFGGDII
ncbi:PI31 proteasome regulator protein [Pleurostoma richardsiae]|uniref:PI31 proteasome regulator protein n=1 Tax=Pleurostoma richardsiae TaxID=41990 RepID=A0AA38R5S6_9PEZI|nr:PI31 proteasome regulator protein [Pleurostoma richardsiae]